MGHIKEPDGIDFIINGKPLTDKEKKLSANLSRQTKKKLKNKSFAKPRTLMLKSQ
jgi:hypothetical protein